MTYFHCFFWTIDGVLTSRVRKERIWFAGSPGRAEGIVLAVGGDVLCCASLMLCSCVVLLWQGLGDGVVQGVIGIRGRLVRSWCARCQVLSKSWCARCQAAVRPVSALNIDSCSQSACQHPAPAYIIKHLICVGTHTYIIMWFVSYNYWEGEELHGLAVAMLIFAQLPTFVYLSCRKALFANFCIAFHREFSFVFLYTVLFVILHYSFSLRFLLRFHNSLLRPLPKIEKVGCENFIHFYALILWQLRRAPFLQILWLTSQCFWKTWIFIHTSTWSLAQHLETLHTYECFIFSLTFNLSWKKT